MRKALYLLIVVFAFTSCCCINKCIKDKFNKSADEGTTSSVEGKKSENCACKGKRHCKCAKKHHKHSRR